jgi:hypothetical protein
MMLEPWRNIAVMGAGVRVYDAGSALLDADTGRLDDVCPMINLIFE